MDPPLNLMERARAWRERAAHPGSGWCKRCRRPWRCVRYHLTAYTETKACFPLCEGCWSLLGTPEQRLPYYVELLAEWDEHKPVTREIRDAVAEAVRTGL